MKSPASFLLSSLLSFGQPFIVSVLSSSFSEPPKPTLHTSTSQNRSISNSSYVLHLPNSVDCCGCEVKMEEDKIILVHRGYWDGSVYKNGEDELIFTSLLTISFEQFLDVVHGIVEADRRICEYVLHCLIPTEDVGAVKSKIKSERDLQRVARLFRTPKIFVTVEQKHHGTNAPSYYGNHSRQQPRSSSSSPIHSTNSKTKTKNSYNS